ncbi:alpha/beta hydrolase family protein [Streptomyces sp. NPDC005780]|uniref:alpha/beta hydrolase family protein n=1 Tax=Streptomyces sp. NPDC005780 TaxID=3364730 RepID=UPI00368E7F03
MRAATAPDSSDLHGQVRPHDAWGNRSWLPERCVSRLDGPTAPFLILHGDADLLVGPRQSRRLFDALHGAGSQATLVSVHGAGHGFFNTDALERTPPLPTTVHTTRAGERMPDRSGALTSGLVERFFDRHLRRRFSD